MHIIRSESAGDSEVTLRVIAAVGLTPDGRQRQPLFESDVAATIGAKECLGRRARTATDGRADPVLRSMSAIDQSYLSVRLSSIKLCSADCDLPT